MPLTDQNASTQMDALIKAMVPEQMQRELLRRITVRDAAVDAAVDGDLEVDTDRGTDTLADTLADTDKGYSRARKRLRSASHTVDAEQPATATSTSKPPAPETNISDYTPRRLHIDSAFVTSQLERPTSDLTPRTRMFFLFWRHALDLALNQPPPDSDSDSESETAASASASASACAVVQEYTHIHHLLNKFYFTPLPDRPERERKCLRVYVGLRRFELLRDYAPFLGVGGEELVGRLRGVVGRDCVGGGGEGDGEGDGEGEDGGGEGDGDADADADANAMSKLKAQTKEEMAMTSRAITHLITDLNTTTTDFDRQMHTRPLSLENFVYQGCEILGLEAGHVLVLLSAWPRDRGRSGGGSESPSQSHIPSQTPGQSNSPSQTSTKSTSTLQKMLQAEIEHMHAREESRKRTRQLEEDYKIQRQLRSIARPIHGCDWHGLAGRVGRDVREVCCIYPFPYPYESARVDGEMNGGAETSLHGETSGRSGSGLPQQLHSTILNLRAALFEYLDEHNTQIRDGDDTQTWDRDDAQTWDRDDAQTCDGENAQIWVLSQLAFELQGLRGEWLRRLYRRKYGHGFEGEMVG